jgi:hypothetical protein
MNVEIEAETALFPEKEYIIGIFVAVWLSSSDCWWLDVAVSGCCWLLVVACDGVGTSAGN